MQTNQAIAVLVGGSDLFLGARGISKGTRYIRKHIVHTCAAVAMINYNYFLDFGRSLELVNRFVLEYPDHRLVFYGYSKGADVVLRAARILQEDNRTVDLLITIDIANGPWSHLVNRNVPGNVGRCINVFQRTPNFPLRSHGLPSVCRPETLLENIDMTKQIINGRRISHGNIEWLLKDKVVSWICSV